MRSCSADARRARPLLGTLAELSVTGRAAALDAAIAAAFAALADIERLMSFHDPASELARLNRDAHRQPVPVSAATHAVLARALELARASDGAFDPCIAPALRRLGFLPGVADERSSAGWTHVELLPGPRVRFARPLALDLGGIAKGFAVDRAARALERHGIDDYCVNAGGDLRIGRVPRPVVVRHPAEPRALVRLGEFADVAVATSARYFSERRDGGGSVHPIVVPSSGRPASYGGSISVIASDCIDADALTKVVAVAGRGAAPVLECFAAEAWLLAESGAWTRLPVPRAA